MKRLLTFCLFLLAFTFLQAQTDRRLWSQGPLTWNDFTIMPASFGQRSYLQYGIGYNPVRDTLDGVTAAITVPSRGCSPAARG